MRAIAIFLMLGYCSCQSVFSQDGKRQILLSGGNNFYLAPYTGTSSFAPHAGLLFIASADDSGKTCVLSFVAGISYARSSQQFNVLWAGSNTNQARPVTFFTDEYLFSTGGGIQFLPQKRFSVSLGLLLQVGQNYTWTNDTEGRIGMGRVVCTRSGMEAFITPSGAHYTTRSRTRAYRWAYLQLYLVPAVNFMFAVSPRLSLCAGLSIRTVFHREFLGSEGTYAFNYAPYKLNPQAGVLLNLLKKK
jgi:hypothetical protein